MLSPHDCASKCDFCGAVATFDALLSGRSRTRGVVSGSSTPIRGAPLSPPSSSSKSDEVGDDGDLMHPSDAAASTLVVGFVRTLLDPTKASILSGRSRIRVGLLSWMISRIENRGDLRSVSKLLELPKRRVSQARVRPDDAPPLDAEFRPRPRALQSKLAETFKKLVDWINRELPVSSGRPFRILFGSKKGLFLQYKKEEPISFEKAFFMNHLRSLRIHRLTRIWGNCAYCNNAKTAAKKGSGLGLAGHKLNAAIMRRGIKELTDSIRLGERPGVIIITIDFALIEVTGLKLQDLIVSICGDFPTVPSPFDRHRHHVAGEKNDTFFVQEVLLDLFTLIEEWETVDEIYLASDGGGHFRCKDTLAWMAGARATIFASFARLIWLFYEANHSCNVCDGLAAQGNTALEENQQVAVRVGERNPLITGADGVATALGGIFMARRSHPCSGRKTVFSPRRHSRGFESIMCSRSKPRDACMLTRTIISFLLKVHTRILPFGKESLLPSSSISKGHQTKPRFQLGRPRGRPLQRQQKQ